MATFTELYCDPVSGSNLNAGSTNTAPVYSGVGDSDGTSVFTPSDGSTPASTVSVGMFASVYVTLGATITAFVGRVTAVAAGVNGAITISTTAKSGTFPASSAGAHTISCVVGGYWKGPNNAVSFPFGFIAAAMTDVAGDYPRVNFKNNATYSITAAMTHALAGPVVFQGMTSSPGDGGRATIDGGTSGASYTLLTVSGNENTLRDLIFQHNGTTGSINGIISSGKPCFWERVTVNNVRGNGFELQGNPGPTCLECEAYACNQSNTSNGCGFHFNANFVALKRCVSHHNSGSNTHGFLAQGYGYFEDCVADSNGLNGFSIATANIPVIISGGAAYGNASDGVRIAASNVTLLVENFTLSSNLGYGVDVFSGTGSYVRLSGCAFFNNTSGQINGTVDATSSITCSAQPLNAPSQGDYTPVAGSGVRNTGRGSFTQNAGSWTSFTGCTSYPDVGAVEPNYATLGGYSRSRVVGGA